MQRTRAVAFIWQSGYGADADKRDLIEALKAVPTLRHVYRLEPLAETDKAPFAGLRRRPASDSAADKTDPNQIVYLAFTSGTTGKPKGVMHSDNTLLANARQLAKDWSIGNDVGGLYAVAAQPQPRLRRAGDGAGDGRRAGHQRPAARRKPRRPHPGNRHELPGRRAAERHRSAGRDAEARAEGSRPADRLPHLGLGGAERGGGRPDRAGHHAAERLRHDRELLAPVHAAGRRPASCIIETSGKCLPGLRASHLQGRRSRHRGARPARSARSAAAARA